MQPLDRHIRKFYFSFAGIRKHNASARKGKTQVTLETP
jgi:hypothetical protein